MADPTTTVSKKIQAVEDRLKEESKAVESVTEFCKLNFPKIDQNKDGRLSVSELKSNENLDDKKLQSIKDFMSRNYNTLKKEHNDDWFSEQNISLKDLDAFKDYVTSREFTIKPVDRHQVNEPDLLTDPVTLSVKGNRILFGTSRGEEKAISDAKTVKDSIEDLNKSQKIFKLA